MNRPTDAVLKELLVKHRVNRHGYDDPAARNNFTPSSGTIDALREAFEMGFKEGLRSTEPQLSLPLTSIPEGTPGWENHCRFCGVKKDIGSCPHWTGKP